MNQDVLKAKQDVVAEITNTIKDSQSFIVCEYRGLSVSQLTELRKNLRANESSCFVYKNTLVRKALADLKIEGIDSYLEGPNAFIFSKDISKGPKVLTSFARKNEHLVVKVGLIEGRICDAAKVKEVAKLPDKNGLISMLLSVLQAPVRQLACTVKAVGEQKQA